MKASLEYTSPSYTPRKLTIEITTIEEYKILKALTSNSEMVSDLFDNYNLDKFQMSNMLHQIYKELS